LTGRRQNGSHDILWLTPAGTEMSEQDWQFAEGRYLSYVLAPVEGQEEPLFLVLNASDHAIEFTLPPWPNVGHWIAVLDTSCHPQAPERSPKLVAAKIASPALSVLGFAGRP
jgi:glycogen operon protein